MPSSLFDLTGRLALITGSSKGLGLTIAEALAEAGAEIILNGRGGNDVDEARERFASAGYKVHAAPFDVTDDNAVERSIELIERDVGPIDILFNNAGIQRRGPLLDVTQATWREVMATDLDAVFTVGRAVARHMIPRGHGKIVNTCSLTSERARPTIAPYATAKSAVKMLTKAMCAEWAQHGLQINGIGPGYFKTEMNEALFTDANFTVWLKQSTPAGRWGELDELKGTAVFLAADASNFVNGQIIYVDGGLLTLM
jgi:gluconate 5-dehydrogenase